MASPPLPGGPRHVGRVIDPSVREDGELDPAVELADEPAAEPPSNASPAPVPADGPDAAGAEQRSSPGAPGPTSEANSLGDLDQIGAPERDALSELEVSTPSARAPSAPFYVRPGARLSPTWVAVFATLLGVASIAFLSALGMILDVRLPPPKSDARARASAHPTASPAPREPEAAPKHAREKLPGPWRVDDARSDGNLRVVEGKVGGEPFLKAMEKAGVAPRETYRVLTALKGVRDFDRTKRSDRFVVSIERSSSRLKAFEYIESPEDVYQAREAADGLLRGSKLDLKVERQQVSRALAYDGKSFDASAERFGFDSGLARVVARAIDGHSGLDELERGDRLRVIVREVTVLGQFARYAGVEALEIQPATGDRKPLRIYYFDGAGERGYYDAEGRSPYEGGWRKPIKDAPITSPFNLKRLHPVLKRIMPHLGIDFGAPTGTPVGAASFGTVTFAGFRGPTGNLVKLLHAGGIETGYAHLSRFAEGLEVGDKVKRLQVIGYVGSTGRSTGPHLHFSATKDRGFFDPATLGLDSMRSLSKSSREAFGTLKAKYDAALDAIPLPEALPAAASAVAATPAANASGAALPSAPSAEPTEIDEEDDLRPAAGSAPGAATSVSATLAPAGTTSKAPGSAVYLTDKELLELQGASDEGEVAE